MVDTALLSNPDCDCDHVYGRDRECKLLGIVISYAWQTCCSTPDTCKDIGSSACIDGLACINSLTPGKFEWKFRYVIFKRILVTDGWDISCEISLIWMCLDFAVNQSTLVQVMAWCCQAASHYLSQCWPRSLSPYGVIRPQWVCWSPPGQNGCLTDNIFKRIFMNEKFCILTSLKFIPKCLINNIPAFVQIMAWRRSGNKTLSEPMLTRFTDAHMQH